MNLKEWFKYDYETGLIYWVKSPSKNIKIGDIAGKEHSEGYLIIRMLKFSWLCHRLGWFLYYGFWPTELDHINGNKKDNRIKNLREVTKSQNQQNNKKQINKTSEFKGVSWCKSRKKWCSYIKLHGKTFNLGRFENETQAAKTYNEAAMKYFGEFASINEVE
jgi:hypothetical protein